MFKRTSQLTTNNPSVASFTKEVNSRLAKRPLIFNGRLANRGLTSLVKEAAAEVRITGICEGIPPVMGGSTKTSVMGKAIP